MQDTQFENHLIKSIRAGNSYLFEPLMKPYSRRLFEIAACALRNNADAEDVVQEVQIKVFTRLGQFRGEARFSSWLYRILFNEIRQYRRRNPERGFQSLKDSDYEDRLGAGVLCVAPNVLEALEAEAARTALSTTLNRLPASLRSAIVMYHLQELPIAATAARMGITEGGMKTRLLRARRQMHLTWTSIVRAQERHRAA